jgi:hypothetical protein
MKRAWNAHSFDDVLTPGMDDVLKGNVSNVSRYHSFLLRIWCVGDAEHAAWRASLEDPHTRQVLAFDSRAALCDFLLRLGDANEGVVETAPALPALPDTAAAPGGAAAASTPNRDTRNDPHEKNEQNEETGNTTNPARDRGHSGHAGGADCRRRAE